MYPQPELARLAQRKSLLVHRIRVRRAECAGQMHAVLRPAVWAGEMRDRWKSFSPLVRFAVVPAGLMLVRKFWPRLGSLATWAPLAVNFFRSSR